MVNLAGLHAIELLVFYQHKNTPCVVCVAIPSASFPSEESTVKDPCVLCCPDRKLDKLPGWSFPAGVKTRKSRDNRAAFKCRLPFRTKLIYTAYCSLRLLITLDASEPSVKVLHYW